MDRGKRPNRPPAETITLPTGHKVPIDLIKEIDIDGKGRNKRLIEKLPTLSGSIAGANSRFMQDYQVHREREQRRLAGMERASEEEVERVEFEKQTDARKRAIEEEAAKKRDRRQRRKLGKPREDAPLPSRVLDHIKAQEAETHASMTQSIAAKSVSSHPYLLSTSAIRIIDEE